MLIYTLELLGISTSYQKKSTLEEMEQSVLICATVGSTDMYVAKRKECSPAVSFKLHAISAFHFINDSSANLACQVLI